ncbi:MAG: hypothetical protein AAF628_34565 [Planctomycetota bacterium]
MSLRRTIILACSLFPGAVGAQSGVDVYERSLPTSPNLGTACFVTSTGLHCEARWQAAFRVPPFDTFDGRRTLERITTTGTLANPFFEHVVRNDTGAPATVNFQGPTVGVSIRTVGGGRLGFFGGFGVIRPYELGAGETTSSTWSGPDVSRSGDHAPFEAASRVTVIIDCDSQFNDLTRRFTGWTTLSWIATCEPSVKVELHYSGARSPWTDLGGETGFMAQAGPLPILYGRGEGLPGSQIGLVVDAAPSSGAGALLLSTGRQPIPVFQSVLVPDLTTGIAVPIVAAPSGSFRLNTPAPTTSGVSFVAQAAWVAAPMSPVPVDLTNAIEFVTP